MLIAINDVGQGATAATFMTAADHQRLIDAVDKPGGLVLLSGHVGDGKNSVAYHLLRRGAARGLAVNSAETHPRQALDGVNQLVDEDLWGRDAAFWEHVVNEPSLDLLYVRELRSFDVANAVVTAAARRRTRFISTIHTNDATQTPIRLLNMGIEPWKVTDGLRLVQAQRRLCRLCPECKRPRLPAPQVFADADVALPELIYTSAGCAACGFTGVEGSLLVCEQLLVDDELRALLLDAEDGRIIDAHARRRGLRTLRQAALDLVAAGQLSLEEALLETAPHQDTRRLRLESSGRPKG